MSYFSLEDLFEQSDDSKPSAVSKVMQEPPSDTSSGVFAIMVPDTTNMSKEQMVALFHQNMGALVIQEALLNALADLLIEKGILTELELKQCFEDILSKGSLPPKE